MTFVTLFSLEPTLVTAESFSRPHHWPKGFEAEAVPIDPYARAGGMGVRCSLTEDWKTSHSPGLDPLVSRASFEGHRDSTVVRMG